MEQSQISQIVESNIIVIDLGKASEITLGVPGSRMEFNQGGARPYPSL